jgi:hypothetical protein
MVNHYSSANLSPPTEKTSCCWDIGTEQEEQDLKKSKIAVGQSHYSAYSSSDGIEIGEQEASIVHFCV